MEQVKLIAEKIAVGFPSAELTTNLEDKSFAIWQNQKILIEINMKGATCFFPTRGNGVMSWSGVKEGGPNEIAGAILRKLADAGFEVFTSKGEKMRAAPIRIGEYTICPKCNEMGFIKIFQYGKPKVPFDLEQYVLAGRNVKVGDPQILCTKCDWTGLREDVRFTKKIKKTF